MTFIADLKRISPDRIAEGIDRMRRGKVRLTLF
ncbi:MAG: endonuclease Q family protein [Acidobacteria bacterium]|nr:endonuclease Q family protein [Acidobacteriota bacterium]MBU4254480.1 endonuclease Q family protein [Acidobacteriota bacterium]